MRVKLALVFALLLGPAPGIAALRRILYVTHSAGYRHDSIPASVNALREIASRTGVLEITATEDLSLINAANLSQFDAIFFFTSGELPLSAQQRQDLLNFVRSGKGFGGAHSATDTLYSWEEYGELTGGYFDGHPWVQEVGIDVEDPQFPGLAPLAPSFRIVEEIYQHRAFSRDRVRVLLSLDASSVNLQAPGVNRTDGDFALAWCRNYGQGRVFYTALGHFEETWRDPRIARMMEGALLWLTGEIEADALPRSTAPLVEAVATPVGQSGIHAPGAIVSVYGRGLTNGASWSAATDELPTSLAGSRVELDGRPIPLYFVSPSQINAQLPFDLSPGASGILTVNAQKRMSSGTPVRIGDASPALLAGIRSGGYVVLYASGLGPIEGRIEAGWRTPLDPLLITAGQPVVTLNGTAAEVTFSGLAPTLIGVYQINAIIPGGMAGAIEAQIAIHGALSNRLPVP